MEFKRIQCNKTRLIIGHYVNGKKMTYEKYESLERRQKNNGKNYNSSTTTRNKENNFVHIHYYN